MSIAYDMLKVYVGIAFRGNGVSVALYPVNPLDHDPHGTVTAELKRRLSLPPESDALCVRETWMRLPEAPAELAAAAGGDVDSNNPLDLTIEDGDDAGIDIPEEDGDNGTFDPVRFMLGGLAEFEIDDQSNGKTYSFLVKQKKQPVTTNPVYFIYCGPPAERVYAGYLKPHKNLSQSRFDKGKSGMLDYGSPEITAFMSVLRGTDQNYTLRHIGKCGFCGMKLTDPASIQRGFGPTCWKKIKLRDNIAGGKED